MKRRTLLSVFFCSPVLAAVHSVSQVLNDGSLYQSGYRNGYPFNSTVKVGSDASVAKYELNLTCMRANTVEGMLRAAGFELGIKNDFSSLPGQALINVVEDVAGSFNILVNGQLFLFDSASTYKVAAGQKITVRLAAPGTMVPK